MLRISYIVTSWLLLVSGCSTGVRAPICEPDEFDFPAEYQGWYRITEVGTNPAYSGMNFFPETEIKIERQTHGLAISMSAKTRQLLLQTRLGSFVHQSLKVLGAGDVNFSGDFSTICRVGEHFYTQSFDGHNTYTLSKVLFSASGFTVLSIAMDPEEMRTLNVPVYFVPNVSEVDSDGFIFNQMNPLKMYVDNRHLERTVLLEKAHTVGIGMSLIRVYREPSRQNDQQNMVTMRIGGKNI